MAITSTGGAKGEKSSASPAPFISTSFLPSSSEIHTVLYQRFMLQEAIKDVSAAITKGILSNSAPCEFVGNPPTTPTTTTSPSSRQGRSATSSKPTAYISALDRLEKLQEGSKQIKTLFQEFATLTESSTTIGGTSMIAARAAASKELFLRECDVEDEDELVTPSKKVDAAANNNDVAEAEKSKETLQAMKKEIAPLQKILKDLQQVTRLPGYQYEASIQKAKTGKAPAASSGQSLHLLQKRLEETLGGVMKLLETAAAVATNRGKPAAGGSHASSSSSSLSPVTIRPQVLRDITTWPAQFIQIVQQSANIKPLEVLTEPKREQLRRIAFDVEELQHDQEQAVTDGDMQKSEQLYFEQTDLLEGMKPCFEELENVIKKFKSDRGEAMLKSLKLFKQSFSPQYALAVAREEKAKSRKDGDRGRLVHRRGLVEKARAEQKAGLAVYMTEWEKMYDQTIRQQAACFQAMDELEKRIASLAGDQAILIQDRLEKVNTERERGLDAAAFYHFCDRRQAEVQVAQKNVDVSTQILKDVGSSIEFGINQLENFLSSCIRDHAQEEYVQLQKEKLDQFRQLYITLGDLLFKKARSADEIEKRIEYYALQQEVAMDALNPKAKEYSQAKKKWLMVRQELEKQLKALEEKSAKEAADFEPTAALLLENGVSFTHPVEEVARRNKVREQKLLEYKELMDEKVEEQRRREEALRDAAGGGPEMGSSSADDMGMRRGIPIRDDDEVVLAEKMRKEEEEAAAILAVSARFHSTPVTAVPPPRTSVAGPISSTTVKTPSSPPRSAVPKARLTSMDCSNTTSKHKKRG